MGQGGSSKPEAQREQPKRKPKEFGKDLRERPVTGQPEVSRSGRQFTRVSSGHLFGTVKAQILTGD